MAKLVIKFSHKYNKMPEGFEHSKLLDVLLVPIQELSKQFLEYDTTYEGGNYPLPKKGMFMILLLQSEKAHLWTTIRRSTKWKLAYYSAHIGDTFECIITDGEE